jgi:hypothetical protein
MNVLGEIFSRRLVSLRRDVGWPARSPDLSICDLFLWEYLKENVFKYRPHTLPELMERIIEEVNTIPCEMCERASEIISNNVLLLTDANLRTLFSKVNDN